MLSYTSNKILYMIGILVNKQQVSRDYDYKVWDTLQKKFDLTDTQRDQFKRYALLLIEWNKKFNLTAILDAQKIAHYHFYDSLHITEYINFSMVSTIADIGTGAGFPALPIKIMYPHLKVTLIEVNSKKRAFLEYLIKEFELEQVIVIADDWRTFLRETSEESQKIDYFFARASLQPDELVRLFKPSSHYKNATLVYWATQQWEPSKQEAPFVKKEVEYTIDSVQRKYVFFNHKK
jgi:16S rRNA (guanine(527)-N(7))-methyltransferase RsmG